MAYLELFLDLCQLFHLLPELEGGHDRIVAGQCHVGGAGQGAVCVQTGARSLQRVVVLFSHTVRALAGDRMRLFDRVVDADEHLNDLVVIAVCSQDQRRDVRRKLTFLVGAEERVLLRSFALFRTGDVVRMFDDDFDQLRGSLADTTTNSSSTTTTTTTTNTTTDTVDPLLMA